ncbi:B3 domain-containing protein At2g31420-like [Cucurbita maxima]|uniref:B3 domain-containing protein At2g31420-like n=2 Tax=Cucurbita maxima TaxID=3661 RepID=A0A6J1JSG9_CUCMA|nr:B3 domain-containing protein At2g31420-like [Cucurbita maxima]
MDVTKAVSDVNNTRKRKTPPTNAAARKKMAKRCEYRRLIDVDRLSKYWRWAASTLMHLAKTVPNVEKEKSRNTRKRKTPTSSAPTRRKMVKKTEYPSIPEMSDGMRERIMEMGGREIHLVIQKQVQHTDISKNHGRLSLPINKLRFDFTTEEEKKLLDEQENKNKKGMNVVMIYDVGRESIICLKKWKIGSSDTYCLMTQWNKLVEETALKAGEHIQLWCFRKDEAQLCLAMVKLGSC